MHGVALGHVAIVGIHKVVLYHLYGEYGKRIGVVAVRGGNISFYGMGYSVHTGVGDQLLGHSLSQIRIDYGHIRSYLKIGYRVFDALCIIGDYGEGGNLGSGAGGGGYGAEAGLFPQLGQAEHLAHIFKRYLGVFIFYPHGLGGIYRGTAAHSYYPIRLELLHRLSAAHNGFNGGSGSMRFKQLDLHAGFLKISDSLIKETKLLHTAAANAYHCALALKCLKRLKRAFSMIKIAGQSKTCHKLTSFPDLKSSLMPLL